MPICAYVDLFGCARSHVCITVHMHAFSLMRRLSTFFYCFSSGLTEPQHVSICGGSLDLPGAVLKRLEFANDDCARALHHLSADVRYISFWVEFFPPAATKSSQILKVRRRRGEATTCNIRFPEPHMFHVDA